MKLDRQLDRWQRAGLLSEAAAAAILAHEQKEHPGRPYLLYALGGLGALAVATGLLSIVAANWDEIPAGTKLALDLALLLGLAVGVFLSDAKARSRDDDAPAWAREILIFLYYGATLASIGLVAQTYQQGGEVYHALLLWTAATAPLLIHARGRFLSAVWLVALAGTWLFCLVTWSEAQDLPRKQTEVLIATGVALVPLSLLGLGLLPPVRRLRPQLSAVAAGLGGATWLFLTSAAQLLWYERHHYHGVAGKTAGAGILLLLLASVAIAAALPRSLPPAARRALQVLLVLGMLAACLPVVVEHDRSGLANAFGFLILWSAVGYAALRLRRFGLFNLATALIALRLLGIYFELFGSLLNTGLGLFSGGFLTLILAYVWLQKTRRAREKEAANHGA